MLESTKQRLAAYLLVTMLLSVTLKDIQIFSGLNISFYRLIVMPIVLLLLLFSLGEGLKDVRLRAPTFIIVLLFVIWTLLTCFFSRNPEKSTNAWLQFYFQYFLVSYATVTCINRTWSKSFFVMIANVMQIVGLIISASIFLAFFFGIGRRVGSTVSTYTDTCSLLGGTFTTVVKLAIALSMSIFLFLHYKRTGQNLRSKFSLMSAIIFLVAFFVGGSRTGMGVAFCLLAFMIAVKLKDFRARRRQAIIALASAMILLFITNGLFSLDRLFVDPGEMSDSKWSLKIQKYASLYEQIKTGRIKRSSSLGERLHLILVDAPGVFNKDCARRLLFGVGLEQFVEYTESGLSAENAYLSYLVETGLIGGLLFLALIVQLGRTFYEQWRRAGNNSFQFYLFVAFLGLALYFMFELTLRYTLIWRFYIPLALFFESRQSNLSTSRPHIQSLNSRRIKT